MTFKDDINLLVIKRFTSHICLNYMHFSANLMYVDCTLTSEVQIGRFFRVVVIYTHNIWLSIVMTSINYSQRGLSIIQLELLPFN